MESGFKKEFPPPSLLFQAVPLSKPGVAFWTVANTACPLSSWKHFPSDFQRAFIPSLPQHLCFSCAVGALLAHGLYPQPPRALLGHPCLVLPHPVCRWVDGINWRGKREKLPWGLNAGIPTCFGGPGFPGKHTLCIHKSHSRACEERGSRWNLCPSEVPSISGGWLRHGK